LKELKELLQQTNEKHMGVFRNDILLTEGFSKLKEIYKEFKDCRISNQNLMWNEELVAYFELEYLILNSLAACFSALNRKESRGAHYHNDFPNRDDKNFLAHSLVKIVKNNNEGLELDFSLQAVRSQSKIAELKLISKERKY
jgi:succinate dehydrogenase/fumarate reductase flavoprotein subunit